MKNSGNIKSFFVHLLGVAAFFMLVAVFTNADKSATRQNDKKPAVEWNQMQAAATPVSAISLPNYNKSWIASIDVLHVRFIYFPFSEIVHQNLNHEFFNVFQKKRLFIKPKIHHLFIHYIRHSLVDPESILS